jgi:hypothetical protein
MTDGGEATTAGLVGTASLTGTATELDAIAASFVFAATTGFAGAATTGFAGAATTGFAGAATTDFAGAATTGFAGAATFGDFSMVGSFFVPTDEVASFFFRSLLSNSLYSAIGAAMNMRCRSTMDRRPTEGNTAVACRTINASNATRHTKTAFILSDSRQTVRKQIADKVRLAGDDLSFKIFQQRQLVTE